jgi:polar amino acid transport system substrate-binding protein
MMTLIFITQVIFAEENAKNNEKREIEIMAGLAKPPFIVEENGKGIELDIFHAAFATVNKEVTFIHVPFGRTITSLQRLNADGIITVLPKYKHPSLFVSQPYITYQNVAVSLLDNQLEIDDIESLSGKTMIAFQNAHKYLGDEFNKSTKSSLGYREVADQMKQIEMLFMRRTEVIILDINIFKFFLKTHTSSHYEQPFKVHYIFKERPYSAAFKTAKDRDMFDQGIKSIKAQGTYQAIMDKYIDY